MLKLLKVFVRGLIVTLLLPFIVTAWVLYGVYCIGLFLFMFIKTTIEYFQGKNFNSVLPEELEARRIVLEQEKQAEQAKDMLNIMYENTMAQQQQFRSTETILPEEKEDEKSHDFLADFDKEDINKGEGEDNDSSGY